MRVHKHKWNIWGRRLIVLVLLCGLLMPAFTQTKAATITYNYERITSTDQLPRDSEWHDFFIAWEDTDDANKVWFADYHWYTADGTSNIDAGGSHWMEYKAASTLPDGRVMRFTSKDSLGHMQIKYAGKDKDNGNSPTYYIRVEKMHGGYSYFTKYEPTNDEEDADEFTILDMGSDFHIFVSISGKADRYLTRDGQNLETTESSSYGGSSYWRPLRLYKKTHTIDDTMDDIPKEVIGKRTMYEYTWMNTLNDLNEVLFDLSKEGTPVGKPGNWVDIMLAWEDATDEDNNNPAKVWYTKEIWYDAEGKVNYDNHGANEWWYYSNDYIGSDGFGSPNAESFILPYKASHFQTRWVDWDTDNKQPLKYNSGLEASSPMYQFRFDIGRGKYIYIGNDEMSENIDDAESYSVQLRWETETDPEIVEADKKGYVWIFNNITAAQDEYFCRYGNTMSIGNWGGSDYWEFPFRIYTVKEVVYDAIVKNFTIGKGATYSIEGQLILNRDVTITVEDGGILIIDDQLLNNGKIIVKNGGTVLVNEGGCIMSYDQEAEGKITLDGGNMIIMEGAKVICDKSGGILQVGKGSTIVNRGMLMIGEALVMNQSSYLKNETTGILAVGGKIGRERGAVGSLSPEELLTRISNGSFTFLCSTNSKLHNYGTISAPRSDSTPWTSGESKGILNKGKVQGR